MTNLELLRNFYQAVWVEGDIDALEMFFTPDATSDGWTTEFALKMTDFRELVESVNALVENMETEIVAHVEDGDRLAALLDVQSTCRRTGAPVHLSGQVMIRTENGRIKEAHNHFDVLGFFVQLGMIPPDLSMRLLAGGQGA